MQWLTAVELGLLKGRHPLLKDVDVTINPSKGLALVDGRASSKSDSKDKLLNLTIGYSEKNSPSKIQSKYARDIGRLPPETKGLQEEDNGVGRQTNAVDAGVQEEEGANSFHNERGQVLQTAQVVMNMLDVTMPDTLSVEQKKKVLNAVGQGEMLMKALQDAVPGDVREKLTGSVVGIVQSQGSNLKFDELFRLGHIPDVASGLNSKLQEKIRLPTATSDEEVHSSDQNKRSNDSGVVDHSLDNRPEFMELENQSSENLEKSNEISSIQSTSSHWSNNPDSENDDLKDVENNFENEQFSRYNLPKNSDDRENENVPEISANFEFSCQYEGPDGTDDISSRLKKVEKECVKGQSDLMEENNKHNHDFSTDQSKVTEVYHTEDKLSAPSSSSETQLTENEAENNQNKEEIYPQPVSSQNSATPPTFSVSQALDALTGFDDSTQVAVKSVFHVIEGMIDQLDVKKEDENEVKDGINILDVNGRDKVKNSREGSAHLNDHDYKSEKMDNLRSNPSIPSVSSNDLFNPEGSDENYKLYNTYDGCDHDSSLTSKANRQFGTSSNFAKYLNDVSGKVPGCIPTFPYGDPLYKEYLEAYLLSEMQNAKPLDLDTKLALYLDYFPEDGQWKLLEQIEDNISSGEEFTTRESCYRDEQIDAHSRSKYTNNIIEPSYVKLDSGEKLKQNEEFVEMNMADDNIEFDESMRFIKNIILECLNAEVSRRISAADMEELEVKVARDIEHVANAVFLAARHGKKHVSEQNGHLSEKLGSLHGESIIRAISFAVQDTPYLREVLPVGVIVGSTLAALRKFFNVSSLDSNGKNDVDLYKVGKLKESLIPVDKNEINERLSKKIEDESGFGPSISKDEDNIVLHGSSSNKIMVGAVTAALGASALLAYQQNTETDGTLTEPLKEEENSKEPSKLEEMAEKTQNNLVTSLAEKAMSVASPVVPIKEDGEVDHERLVTMLAELGQKGGVLKLVGKVALLWGGMRGAMSLADKLISFLQIAERPLFQRILGFVFMVLLLWSPIIVPLFPSLMRSWATQNPFKVVELACIAGLYVSIVIMVMLWGKRIHKYDDPLLQYGLDLTSIPKFQNFLKGFAGGAMLVLLIHSVNSSLGCVQLCWPTTLSSSYSELVTLMKSYARMLLLIVQGIATATGVATVEELLFRSWLPQEIAADVGYHHGIIISGLVFSLSQRSIWEIPGLWLLSLSLSGAQQRNQGSLSLPVGLRTGILACNFILKTGGFLTFKPSFPLWITGGDPFQPFSGVVGLAFSLVLAIIMYPRQPLDRTETTRAIRE